MTKDFYNWIFETTPYRWGNYNMLRQVDKTMRHLLNNYENIPMKIIDLGCGIGLTLHHIYRPEWKLYGIDAEKKAIELAKENLNKNITLTVGDMTDTKYPDNYFDIVYSLGAFEHLTTPSFFEPRRIVKEDGLFICKLPAVADEKLSGKKISTFSDKRKGRPETKEHFEWLFTEEQWIKLISSYGFLVNKKKNPNLYMCAPI